MTLLGAPNSYLDSYIQVERCRMRRSLSFFFYNVIVFFFWGCVFVCVCVCCGWGERGRVMIILTNAFLGLINGTLLVLKDIIAYLLVMTSSSLITSFFSKKVRKSSLRCICLKLQMQCKSAMLLRN